jgi:hypothetical protein
LPNFRRANFPDQVHFWSKRIVRKNILFCVLFWAVILSISASPVMAQNVLWVGPNGDDSNACSQTAPCATFAGAYAGGSVRQINCLGSGFYGPITITGSLTIDCGAGNVGNIVSSSAAAITINTNATTTIILRHLDLNGLSNNSGPTGINAGSFFSGTLIVEDCMIHGYSGGFGIDFSPTNGRGLLQVSNSQFFGNNTGIIVITTSGQIASVTLNRVELVGNASDGLLLGGSGVVAGTMRGSVVGENGTSGVLAQASQVFLTIEESSIVANLVNGIQTNSANAIVNVGSSTIGGNGTGVKATAGQIISFGNNQMSVNAVNGTFTSTVALQ